MSALSAMSMRMGSSWCWMDSRSSAMTGPTASRARSYAAEIRVGSGVSATLYSFVTRDATSEISKFSVRTICRTVSSLVSLGDRGLGDDAASERGPAPTGREGRSATATHGRRSSWCAVDACARASQRSAWSPVTCAICASSSASRSAAVSALRASSARASASTRPQNSLASSFSATASTALARSSSTRARSFSHSTRVRSTVACSCAFSTRIRRTVAAAYPIVESASASLHAVVAKEKKEEPEGGMVASEASWSTVVVRSV